MWDKVQLHSHANLFQGGALGDVTANSMTLTQPAATTDKTPSVVQALALNLLLEG